MTRKLNLSNFEFKEVISSIQNAWYTFVEEGQSAKEMIRPEILTSWERSRNFGVDPFKMKIEKMLEKLDLMNSHQKNRRLLEIAQPEMKYLAECVQGSETIITISDKNGLLLDMNGDHDVLKEGEKIHFMPGAIWSEEVGGTNAVGTVIKSHKPVQILFNEHFCTGWHDWFCAAAPILDPLTNELLGVLDISGKWKNVNSHTLGLAISKANQISNSIGKVIYQDSLQGNPFLAATVGSFEEGIFIVDTKKKILKMNENARVYFRDRAITSISHLPALEQLVELVLHGKENVVKQEITLYEDKQKFVCSVHPVLVDDRVLGAIIRFFESSVPSSTVKRTSGQVQERSTTRYTFDHMMGSSPTFIKVVNHARKAAMLNSTLFLSGETGTGKELFAQAIHQASERRDKPFIAINCGAIPRELIESELFGYEPGAFTGAKSKGSAGKFEVAQGGTIFLDEIGDMPLTVQVHLLRILEEKVVTRIGGSKPIPIDVRVIAATHKNLMEAVRKGKFREDLLFRLRVIQLRLPALRERTSDIPILAAHFLQQLGPQYGKTNISVHPETMKCLQAYPWPGNIRELKNVMEQSLFNMEGDVLLPYDLPPEFHDMQENPLETEKDQLIESIRMAGGSIGQAAQKLGISRATMYRKIKQYGITAEEYKEQYN